MTIQWYFEDVNLSIATNYAFVCIVFSEHQGFARFDLNEHNGFVELLDEHNGREPELSI